MRVIPVVRLGSFLFIGDKYSMDGYTKVCLSIHPAMDICIISSLGFLGIKLL